MCRRSFGGFSVYWLAGHHDKRFKVFIAHDGIFNMEMQYLETEEMWFANWDMGGAYWEKQNATAQRTFANFRISSWTNGIRLSFVSMERRITGSG